MAVGEMCVEGMGQLKRGMEVVAVGEMCIEVMGAVEQGLGGGGTW